MLYRNFPANSIWTEYYKLHSQVSCNRLLKNMVSMLELDSGFLLLVLCLYFSWIELFFTYMGILAFCLVGWSLSLTGSQYVLHGICSHEMMFSWVLTLTSLVQKQFWHLSTKTEELGYKFQDKKVHILIRHDMHVRHFLISKKSANQSIENKTIIAIIG